MQRGVGANVFKPYVVVGRNFGQTRCTFASKGFDGGSAFVRELQTDLCRALKRVAFNLLQRFQDFAF